MKAWVSLLLIFLFSCTDSLPVGTESHEEVERIFQMSTVDMIFREVIYHKSSDKIFDIDIQSGQVLFAVDIKVQAGFDLSKGYSLERFPNGQGLSILFPQPQILTIDADETSVYQYLTQGKPLGYLKLQSLFQERHEPVRQEALRLGILDQARRQARTFLTELFLSLGYSKVVVDFRRESDESTP